MIKAEWLKLAKSSSFRLLLSCTVCFGILMAALVLTGTRRPFGYEALDNYLSTILIHSIVTFAFAAVFINSEFANHTFGISLLCGVPRFKIFLAKFIVFYAGVLLLILVPTAAFSLPVSVANGFGITPLAKGSSYLLSKLFFAATGYAALSAVAFLTAVAVKHNAATITIGILGTYSIMVAEANLKNVSFYKYIYICQIESLYQPRSQNLRGEIFSAGIYLTVMVITFLLSTVTAAFLFEKSEF